MAAPWSLGKRLRLFYVVALGLSQSAETDEYERIAQSLLSGNGFGFQLHRIRGFFIHQVTCPYTKNITP